MAEIGKDIHKAAQLLKEGKLVAIPTDTVYGLAGNAFDTNAIEQIYQVKGRPKSKAFIAQTNSIEKIKGFVTSFPANAESLASKYWPGALTLILDANEKIPTEMLANGRTVGVRICDHPLTLELLELLDFPVALPSANLHGQPSPVTAAQVNSQLGDLIEYILDGGECQIGFESTIVGFNGEKPLILRQGAIAEADILNTLES
ncbi:L-threonylcarbamoyladenylate synthase [Reichenbachiella agarivorans]|uniref:L-threonylcarbamoyladenylate synthase n=1 Tax=Reichenbachiella agarivorans TaxID=2979464 RepID=A0ABY6CKC7_9BACT|nr:L-threonylcarbamoyladenylate synthase [Reichenbachiella agarivorans]UXP30976.1 L-threonylcarbamoyladenylate synthase [Reichenbachiella agarivorans]